MTATLTFRYKTSKSVIAAIAASPRTAISMIVRGLRNSAARVCTYLAARSDNEPNPYYKGRYLVALLVVTYNHVAHPYEVAEVLFRSSRFAQKVERWLQQRCEQFPYLYVNFDGSLGDWKQVKKPVQKETTETKKKGVAA